MVPFLSLIIFGMTSNKYNNIFKLCLVFAYCFIFSIQGTVAVDTIEYLSYSENIMCFFTNGFMM